MFLELLLLLLPPYLLLVHFLSKPIQYFNLSIQYCLTFVCLFFVWTDKLPTCIYFAGPISGSNNCIRNYQSIETIIAKYGCEITKLNSARILLVRYQGYSLPEGNQILKCLIWWTFRRRNWSSIVQLWIFNCAHGVWHLL